MPTGLDELYAEKHSIVDELFIKTADDNYVTARWCFHQNLNVDFLWLAVHCVEKYLKAVLLINGKTSLGYGHDINKLYVAVRKCADDLLPNAPTKPDRMPQGFWVEESFEKFIERLYRDGQADNRYQLYGYTKLPQDLWKLDQLVFNIRRICRPLDVNVVEKKIKGSRQFSNRDVLKNNPKHWTLHSRLEEALEGKLGDEVKKATLVWNFPFAPENTTHPGMSYTMSSKDSVFIRRLFDPLRAGSQYFAHSDALWAWVKSNIKLSKELTKEIEAERSKLKLPK